MPNYIYLNEYIYLKDFYGMETVFISGNPQSTIHNPQFSFFGSGSNLYIDPMRKQQILRHTNFCRNNFKYEITELSNKYIINVNNILDKQQHHLLKNIIIYLFDCEMSSINNIQLKMDDVIFEYDMCKLEFIDKKYSPVFFKCESKKCFYIKLPIELFKNTTYDWINLLYNTPIKLIINLHTNIKIRVDFLTITLDTEEVHMFYRSYFNTKYSDYFINYNDMIELDVKNTIIENKITFDLSHIKDGIKNLSLFFKVDECFIVDHELIENISFCVNNNGKIIEINHDSLQLLYSNQMQIQIQMQILHMNFHWHYIQIYIIHLVIFV